jgi:hypothetical protein
MDSLQTIAQSAKQSILNLSKTLRDRPSTTEMFAGINKKLYKKKYS